MRFDQDALFSQDNQKQFKGPGIFMSAGQKRFSLGNNIAFDDGAAELNSLDAQALRLLGINTVTEHGDEGFVSKVNDITRSREFLRILTIAGGATVDLFADFPALSGISYEIRILAVREDTNAAIHQVWQTVIKTNASGTVDGATSSFLSSGLETNAGWDNISTTRPRVLMSSGKVRLQNQLANDEINVTAFVKQLTTPIFTIEPQPLPGVPQNVSICATSSGLRISWDPVADADQFRIQRKSGSGSFSDFATTTSTQFDDPTPFFDPDTLYDYRVRSENSAGESDWSLTVSGSFNGTVGC